MARNFLMAQRILFILFFILLPSLAVAEQQEYKDYMIEKGDTLWNISNKELKDPFLWPKVWKENPGIKNPDLIYPKQKIKIPLYLLQKEIVPELKIEPKAEPKPMRRTVIRPEVPVEKPVVRKVTPAKKEYLVDKNLLIVSGYITDSVHSIGIIYDTPAETSNLTKGDFAYIRTNKPVRDGDKYYIIYPIEKVKHPVTGRDLGTRIVIVGSGEVVDAKERKILITSSYTEIPIGSLIDNYYEIEPPLAIENPRKPSINGYIVTTMRRIEAHGTWDIVYIDKGKKDGLEVGDMLACLVKSDHRIVNGSVQIINTMPTTSTAIIRKSAKEVAIGDPVTGIKQE